jgi:serine/threonine protein kinase
MRRMIIERPIDYAKFKNMDDAVDFMQKALERNVSMRWSADQLLRHKWLVEQCKLSEVPLEDSKKREIL